jgi:2-C-methyl-D-erythritol 4-phosphate cytidylyltransferase
MGYGGPRHLRASPDSPHNLKITTPDDLVLAELLARQVP